MIFCVLGYSQDISSLKKDVTELVHVKKDTLDVSKLGSKKGVFSSVELLNKGLVIPDVEIADELRVSDSFSKENIKKRRKERRKERRKLRKKERRINPLNQMMLDQQMNFHLQNSRINM